jgi:hypothetical protein
MKRGANAVTGNLAVGLAVGITTNGLLGPARKKITCTGCGPSTFRADRPRLREPRCFAKGLGFVVPASPRPGVALALGYLVDVAGRPDPPVGTLRVVEEDNRAVDLGVDRHLLVVRDVDHTLGGDLVAGHKGAQGICLIERCSPLVPGDVEVVNGCVACVAH